MTQPGATLSGPNGATPPAPVAAQPPAPPPAPVWTEGLAPELSQLVLGKSWKTPADALQSYQHLEKLIGLPGDRVLKLPTAPEDPSWGDVWSKLGRPEKPEQYDLPASKAGEGDFDITPAFREAAHKSGLSNAQASGLMQWYQQISGTALEAAEARETQARQDFDTQRSAAISKQLGAARAESELCADAACARFGLDADLQTALMDGLARGPDAAKAVAHATRFFEVVAKIGAAIGEHRTAAGAGGASSAGFEGSPAWAQAEIAKLEGDKAFMAAYNKGEPWARDRRTELFKKAYPS